MKKKYAKCCGTCGYGLPISSWEYDGNSLCGLHGTEEAYDHQVWDCEVCDDWVLADFKMSMGDIYESV